MTWFLSWEKCLENLQSIEKIRQLLNFTSLQNLKKFWVLAPLSLNLLNQVLGPILRPDQLEILAFKVAHKVNISQEGCFFNNCNKSLACKIQ